MKKFIGLLLCVMFLLGMVGCTNPSDNSSKSGSQTNSSKQSNDNKGEFNESDVLKLLDITEYDYKLGEVTYYIVSIKNNSNFDIRLSTIAKFNDADGNLLTESNDVEYAVQKGQEALMKFTASDLGEDLDGVKSVKYEFSAEEEKLFSCATSNLSYKVDKIDGAAVITVTNNGDETLGVVQGDVLFFKDGKLVLDSTGTFTENSKLNPKQSIERKIQCYYEFDDVKFYLSGYNK